MTKLNSSTRLKVKRDTLFLPDPRGGVYFRNNLSSFRMEGNTIYQWIEKLMPMFNGEQTLGDLTKGLTAPYRDRVYDIGETLYKNGFVRDISKDTPHQLNGEILKKYASQIEFIENFSDSGAAYRFQEYRLAKVLAIGSGTFLVSLVAALIESGLPKFNFVVTDSEPTNRLRIQELVSNAKKTDSDVEIEEVSFDREEEDFWNEVVRAYDWILYTSQDGKVKELRELNLVCKEQQKGFIPAICLDQIGIAGPLVHPDSEGCWESAWRRIHQSSLNLDRQLQSFSTTTKSILANVTVFELFKKVAGISSSSENNQFYRLDLETLEGEWISFIPHPLVTSTSILPRLVEDIDLRVKQESEKKDPMVFLLEYFSLLTSEETGIFHTWEERNLEQLPLSQCYVQAVNPLSDGPADLLPEVICSGFTHEEAKKEAGLTGIEMYVSQMIYRAVKDKADVNWPVGFIGIGAGDTIAEAVCRGLQIYLEEERRKRKRDQQNTIYKLHLGTIEDKRCRYYLNTLTTLNGAPTIGLEEEVLGFPVLWVRSNGRWYNGLGLNTTLALRNALQQALLDAQNQSDLTGRNVESAIILKEKGLQIEIPSCEEITQTELLHSSIQTLYQNNKQLVVYDLSFEPFLKQELAGVFGVQVREGES
ncbi:putative thiazole-containing bacteriocin maturation protein [Bacillus sp. CGMCC 1.16607]|uniref:putative thiazole-containing bacteriocin maturation protein n=1 Tax=Bacillus sp. CGMCC 1.16607 TaxID=3351842 RepID=UPI0036353D07